MRRFLLIVFLLLAATSVFLPAAAGQIYWADETTDTIQRAHLDGSMVEEVIGIEAAENPGAVAIDAAGGKIYWTSFATPPFIPKVKRANLDGTNVEDVVIIGGKARPGGVALDLVNGKVLSTDPSDCGGCGFVDRANLDGSDPEHLIVGLNFPNAIAVDPVSGYLWWSEAAFDNADGIYRSDLEGAGVQLIVDGPDAWGIAVDPGAGKIYWTDENAGRVQRSNLDGTNVEILVPGGLDWPYGIALDLSAGKMYWANRNGGKIQRANLDGSGVEDVLAGLPAPTGVALVLTADEPVSALSIEGALVGALLLLALGTWAISRSS